ncbi:hypothetical protein HF078_01745 [Bacillus sp. RO2]|uniref:hypothetical protein n=1 Tax=Bacillus sp. RO2 TaxID=2723913 RepID=UPI00145E4CDB|nr:hypothetical protein [Bacillus sp. RO2]NMH71791.1 hypothetical protein [Bacillus sp. RO2]
MLHSSDKKDERNKKIKVKAIVMENKWNEAIKAGLNKESVFRIVGLESELEAEKLRKMREQVEVLSLKYNFPSKNDVANIARLLIQIEEKIDRLEAQLQEETTPSGQNQEKNIVKVILEDMAERQAIVSSLLGYDEKIVRSTVSDHDE